MTSKLEPLPPYFVNGTIAYNHYESVSNDMMK